MEGHDYEYVVAAYLKNKGYHGVKVTKASGDYGVDVIAHKGQMKYAVQCKYYSSPVSLGAVQEAVAGKAMYGCNAAMVVTNNTFTKAAEELAAKNNVVLIPGVRSSGATLKGKLKKLGIILLVLFALFMIALTAAVIDTAISQFKSGLYKQAILNIIDLLCVWGVFVGIPIGLVALCKRLLRTAKDKAEQKKNKQIVENTVKVAPQDHKADAVNIPEGFVKYQNLTSSKVEEYNFTPTQKSREETLQALVKLKADKLYIYVRLHDVMKLFTPTETIYVGNIQRKLQIGFNYATQIIEALVSVGFIVPIDGLGYRCVITEQEINSLLTEIENNPDYHKKENTVESTVCFKPSDSEIDIKTYDAMKVFLKENRIAVSLLQRKLSISFARAARIVDGLEDLGFITPADVNGKRILLVSEQEFEKQFAEIVKNNPS